MLPQDTFNVNFFFSKFARALKFSGKLLGERKPALREGRTDFS